MESTNLSFPLLKTLKRYQSEIISILLIATFGAVLTIHTLKIQHSCEPLLKWVDISERGCKSPRFKRPDWLKAPSIPAPHLPSVQLPETPKLSLPSVKLPELPKVSLPSVKLLKLPTFNQQSDDSETSSSKDKKNQE
ncbi:MAG: hypothetical protein SAJ12_12230 [Jaaginema sp. PMC 1079.18]|nr:hypothetical protein [Jaaginema sp. PMC 1080.18]MEC4851773.1 hypothetical protein [Jaaginema sp. PMC 1079.18]MEC4864517.1 hypothetical protein [Jaaginema sp. PMC 1078.18]